MQKKDEEKENAMEANLDTGIVEAHNLDVVLETLETLAKEGKVEGEGDEIAVQVAADLDGTPVTVH